MADLDIQELLDSLENGSLEEKRDALKTIASAKSLPARATQLLPETINILTGANPYLESAAIGAFQQISQIEGNKIEEGAKTHESELIDLISKHDEEAVRESSGRLLARTLSPRAIKQLDKELNFEVEPVKQAIRPSLTTAVERGIEQLSHDDCDSNGSLSRSLQFLARERPSYLFDLQKDCIALLGGQNGEVVVGILVVLYRRHSEQVDIPSDLTDCLAIKDDVEEEEFQKAVQALKICVRAGIETDTVAKCVERYTDWLQSATLETQRRGLTLLEPVAKQSPALVTSDIDLIAGFVRSDDSRQTTLARRTVLNYAKSVATSPGEYIEQLLTVQQDRPALIWLAEDLRVCYYELETDDWELVEMGKLLRSAVAGLADGVKSGQNVPVIWPSFDPPVVIFEALAGLFEGIRMETDVILYSRGTQTWGYKKDIRREYGRFGLDIPDKLLPEDKQSPVAMGEIFPDGYVYDNEKRYNGQQRATTLFLVSNKEQLNVFEDSCPVLFNFHSRVKETEEDLVDTLDADTADRSLSQIYSLYTKREFSGNRVPQYGPPSLNSGNVLPDYRTIQDVLDAEQVHEGQHVVTGAGERTLRELGDKSDVILEGVEAPDVKRHLEEGYEAAWFLIDFDKEYEGWRSFAYLRRFERLPLPPDRLDSWIRERRRQGERGRNSWTTKEFLSEFESFVSSAGTADAHEQMENVLQKLEQHHPLYDALCERVATAQSDENRLAVYVPSPAWRSALVDCLQEDGVLDRRYENRGLVSFHDRDTIRELESCDTLLFVGPQRAQQAGYYLHPEATETVILKYPPLWSTMLQHRLEGFVDLLNRSFQKESAEFVTPPDITVHDPTGGGQARESDPTLPDVGAGDAGTESQSIKNLEQRLAETFDDGDVGEERIHDPDRYGDWETREYEIETKSGETLHRQSGTRLLVEEEDLSDGSTTYRWISPAEVPAGSTILYINEKLWNHLWDKWLDDQYESMGETGVTQQLATWYRTCCDILEEASEQTAVSSQSDALDYIVAELVDADIQRGQNRIRDWFKSISEAEEPLDLSSEPGLTIGPGNVEDIQLIGETFGYDGLTGEEGIHINQSLNTIRGAHIHEGREFRDALADRLNDPQEDTSQILSHSEAFTVESVTDITDD